MKNNKNKNLSKKNIDEKDTEKISGGKKVCDSIFIKNLNTKPLLAYGGPSLRPQPLKYGGIRPKKTSEDIKDLMPNYEDKDKNK